MYMAAAIGARYESRREVQIKKAMLFLKNSLSDGPPGQTIRILTHDDSQALRRLVAHLDAEAAAAQDEAAAARDAVEHKRTRRRRPAKGA